MSENPMKTTVGSDHLRPLKPAIDGLKKIRDDAVKKNAKDSNAQALDERFKRLQEEFDAIEPGKTQMSVYEGLKEKVKRALAEYPKLAAAVKKPGEDDKKPVEITVTYGSSKVEKACKADKNVAGRIDEIRNHGFGYVGHKAVSALKAQGHIHVGNDNGIAFSWKSKTALVIDGYGTKSKNAKSGNSGYEWIV